MKALSPSPAPSRRTTRALRLAAVLLAAVQSARSDNLLPNGEFDHQMGALHGWITDYEWTGNRFYAGNRERVVVREAVAHIEPDSDAGAKLESVPIPFARGFRYTCTLKVTGGPYRIYFAGYRWKPGVRPHENPGLAELRLVYKSKALTAARGTGATQSFELPGVMLSPAARSHLKHVRFITVYIWMRDKGSVDCVTLTKSPDPEMDF